MIKNYFEDYKRAVRDQLKIAKNGPYAAVLVHPSPAQLKKLCLLLHDEGLTVQDERIFRLCFGVSDADSLRKAIDKFENGKLKSLQSFLNGENSEDVPRIELAAILVNLQNRPLHKFIRSFEPKSSCGCDVSSENLKFEEAGDKEEVNNQNHLSDLLQKTTSPFRFKNVIVILLILLCVGYIAKSFWLPSENCMVWKNDHYETISCEDQPQGFLMTSAVIPKDENVVKKMRQIKVDGKTTFFNNENPCIWYAKQNGKLEFFTTPGLHPISGKTLKPMTEYMINKYVIRTQTQHQISEKLK